MVTATSSTASVSRWTGMSPERGDRPAQQCRSGDAEGAARGQQQPEHGERAVVRVLIDRDLNGAAAGRRYGEHQIAVRADVDLLLDRPALAGGYLSGPGGHR
jgi:hypothetical protein